MSSPPYSRFYNPHNRGWGVQIWGAYTNSNISEGLCFHLQGISRIEPEDAEASYSETSTCFYISEGLSFYLWISFVLVE
jgi:hypothetical protein